MNKECHYLFLDGECIHNEEYYQISLATFISNNNKIIASYNVLSSTIAIILQRTFYENNSEQ